MIFFCGTSTTFYSVSMYADTQSLTPLLCCRTTKFMLEWFSQRKNTWVCFQLFSVSFTYANTNIFVHNNLWWKRRRYAYGDTRNFNRALNERLMTNNLIRFDSCLRINMQTEIICSLHTATTTGRYTNYTDLYRVRVRFLYFKRSQMSAPIHYSLLYHCPPL